MKRKLVETPPQADGVLELKFWQRSYQLCLEIYKTAKRFILPSTGYISVLPRGATGRQGRLDSMGLLMAGVKKNETCDIYEKIKLGWLERSENPDLSGKARELGGLEARML